MAEGWARRLFGSDHDIHSAGTHPAGVNPYAIEVMQEKGIDIRSQRSKGLDAVPETAELMVTLCSDAAQECPTYPGAKTVQHWNLPDPVSAWGGAKEVREEFRRVRDEIEKRMQRLAADLKETS
jgi:arsenate reductase